MSSVELLFAIQYEFPDPATKGTWRSSSHRALTAEEITREFLTRIFNFALACQSPASCE
jgi:hypothetical protein